MWTRPPETTIAQNISMVNGVAQVQVYGAQKYAMRAQLDPSAAGLPARSGINEVSAALQSGNTNLPTGTLYGREPYTSRFFPTGSAANALQFGPMVIAYRNGAPVRLNELGRVIDSVQNDKTASWFNGVRAIVLAIQKAARHQHGRGGRQHQEVAAAGWKITFLQPSESTPSTTAPSPFAPP